MRFHLRQLQEDHRLHGRAVSVAGVVRPPHADMRELPVQRLPCRPQPRACVSAHSHRPQNDPFPSAPLNTLS